MKILFLDTGFDYTSEYFRQQRGKVSGCTNVCLYNIQKRSVVQKVIQAIGIYLFPPVLYLIYGEWKKNIDKYDVFIVASRKSAKYAVQYLRKRTNKRIIIWYWNLVTKKELSPEYCRKLGCETWSFDKVDCEKYGMKFGDTYYFQPAKLNSDCMESKYKMFYVGIDRPGREELLNRLGNYLKGFNYRYKFNLTAIPNKPNKNKKIYSKRLDYQEIIKFIGESESILDLNRSNQSGMTLRPLEAIFFDKKLITNNTSIVKYKAYVNENTYILKDNDYEDLIDFLEQPNIEIDNNIKKHYVFSSWLKRIVDDEQAD